MARPPDPLARIKLLAAAEVEFVEHGLDGAKVEQITRRAGISKGAFYLHFTSKSELFRELVESFVARLVALTEGTLKGYEVVVEGSPERMLRDWVDLDLEIFDYLWQNRGLIRLLLEGGSGAQFRYLVDDFLEHMVRQARHVVATCVRKGVYRHDLDLDLAADLIAGVYDRLARRLVREPTRPDLRPALEQVQQVILFGLASPTFSETLASSRSPTQSSELPSEPPARSTTTLSVLAGGRSSKAPHDSPKARSSSRRQARGPR